MDIGLQGRFIYSLCVLKRTKIGKRKLSLALKQKPPFKIMLTLHVIHWR